MDNSFWEILRIAGFILFFVGLFTAIYLADKYFGQIRHQTLQQFLNTLGFLELNEPPSSLTQLLPYATEFKNIFSGNYQNLAVFVCDYTQPAGKSSNTQTVVAIQTETKEIPRFLLRPNDLTDPLKKAIGYQFQPVPKGYWLALQTFEEDGDFSAAFWQQAPAEFWQKLDPHAPYHLSYDGHWFVMYKRGYYPSSDKGEYQKWLDQVIQTYQALLQ